MPKKSQGMWRVTGRYKPHATLSYTGLTPDRVKAIRVALATEEVEVEATNIPGVSGVGMVVRFTSVANLERLRATVWRLVYGEF
jgi:hypothetical protein